MTQHTTGQPSTWKKGKHKEGQHVYYDVFPDGINFKGQIKGDRIEAQGESKEWFEKRGIATDVGVNEVHDIRKKKRKYSGQLEEGH